LSYKFGYLVINELSLFNKKVKDLLLLLLFYFSI